jgi:hypothetical protein
VKYEVSTSMIDASRPQINLAINIILKLAPLIKGAKLWLKSTLGTCLYPRAMILPLRIPILSIVKI